MRSLAIISHTEHYYTQENTTVGLEPTLREINNMIKLFDLIYHIAPLYSGAAHKGTMAYTSNKIIYIPIIPTGGEGIINKLRIFLFMPINLYRIIKIIRKVEWIHFRAPTNLGIFVLPLISLLFKKKKWIKYAGNWHQKSIPLSYKLQRWWLKNNFQNAIVTINCNSKEKRSHLIPFNNPCLSEKEIKINREIGLKKIFNGELVFCFVGRLEKEKGFPVLIDVFKQLKKTTGISKLHCVGQGSEIQIDNNSSNLIPIIFHGLLNRNQVNQIYKESHFIILPSQSEGFPKVLAEASSLGCIPIVPPISSILLHINEEEKNGIVLDGISSLDIKKTINRMKKISNEFPILSRNAMENAKQFTFEKFNCRLENEILYNRF